jgi:tellurite methyltransferase
VERVITGFHVDDTGDWVAELACGHNQHVRHRPPFQVRSWVLTEGGRTARIGSSLRCPLCDRCELPTGLRFVRSSPEWNQRSIPTALVGSHRIGHGTWGMLRVRRGRLRFVLSGEPDVSSLLEPDMLQPIPPGVLHRVELSGEVGFTIDFLAVDRSASPMGAPANEDSWKNGPVAGASIVGGGDLACWAGLVCFECGAIVDRGYHRPGCRRG